MQNFYTSAIGFRGVGEICDEFSANIVVSGNQIGNI